MTKPYQKGSKVTAEIMACVKEDKTCTFPDCDCEFGIKDKPMNIEKELSEHLRNIYYRKIVDEISCESALLKILKRNQPPQEPKTLHQRIMDTQREYLRRAKLAWRVMKTGDVE